MESLGEVSARLFGADPVLHGYLRHVLLEDSAAGATLFGRLLSGARAEVDRLSAVHGEGADPDWAPFQMLCLILGPLLLERVMQPGLDEPMFAPKVLASRSAANQRLLLQGFYGSLGERKGLVVIHHAAQPYGPSDWWYVKDQPRTGALATFAAVNGAFFLSPFFFVSAVLTIVPGLLYAYYVHYRGYPPIAFLRSFTDVYLGLGEKPVDWTGPSWPDLQFGYLWFIQTCWRTASCTRSACSRTEESGWSGSTRARGGCGSPAGCSAWLRCSWWGPMRPASRRAVPVCRRCSGRRTRAVCAWRSASAC